MQNRSTMDIVILVFAGIIAFTVFITITGSIIAEVISPGYDGSQVASSVAELIKTMTTGLLGILAGRGDAYQKQIEKEQKEKENGS